MRVRYFPLQYNKNTKDFRFQTNSLLEFSMHSEPSPQHQMSGNLPPRNREESREKYHEVVLENPGDLTMYAWAQMQALELLPGRVPANESGFHFPGVIRGGRDPWNHHGIGSKATIRLHVQPSNEHG